MTGVGRSWRDRLVAPYIVLLASPVVTFPISLALLASIPDCGNDEAWWELRNFELVLVPGLADFAPFLWVLSRTPGVRKAAVMAGAIGAVRYAVPQAMTLWYSVSFGEATLSPGCSVSIFFVAGLGPVMLGLWAGSAAIVAWILVTQRAAPGTASG